MLKGLAQGVLVVTLQYPPIIVLYFLASFISWLVAYRSWQMRPAQGATLWALAMVSTGLWAFGNGISAMQADLTWRLISIRLLYLGIVSSVYFWGLFTLQYSQFDRWYTKRNRRLLAIVPVLFYVVVFTSNYHNLFYSSSELVKRGDYYFYESTFGPLFWVWAAYAYAVVVGGAGLLIASIVRSPSVYRGQAVILVIGASIPLTFNIFYLTLGGIDGYDPSALGYTITGVMVLTAMRNFHFLAVVPVAHDLVIKSVRSGVIIINERGIIMDINPAALNIFEGQTEEIIGQSIVEAFPQYRDLIFSFQNIDEIKTEITLNGHFYELQIMPLINRSGQKSGRIAMFYDITEQKIALEELDAYAHTVAHDLKNPLGVVLTYMDLIESGAVGEVSPKLQERLKVIAGSSRKMKSIIDSLLMLATVRNTDNVKVGALDMPRLVDVSLRRLTEVIDEQKVQIRRAELWHNALGYEAWVEEIWMNYISNAIKYGGQPPVIELGCDKLPNGQIRYWVKDNGAGIDPEEQEHLFTKSVRLEKHAALEGHGLGLSIVQRIVHKLGGTVGVESKPGQGSLFYFTLPEIPAEPVSLSA